MTGDKEGETCREEVKPEEVERNLERRVELVVGRGGRGGVEMATCSETMYPKWTEDDFCNSGSSVEVAEAAVVSNLLSDFGSIV